MTRVRGFLVLASALALAAPVAAQNPHDLFQQALRKERAEGDLSAAIALYGRVAMADDRALAARALIRIGEGYERLGHDGARQAYEQVLRDFPDQTGAVRTARARLEALGARAGARPRAAAAESDLRLRLVWEDPGVDITGQPTSDGRFVTFVDWESGDLAVRDLATGTHRLITEVGYPQYAIQSSVSNDDGRVAYFWTPGEGASWQPQLRVIGMDGSGERILIANDDREIDYLSPYAWTPGDREILALLTRGGSWDVSLVDVATGDVRVVRSLTHGTSSRLSLSPDGEWIAYDQAVDPDDQHGNRDVHVVAADGSRSFAVAEHPATDHHPIFAPDGRHLLFTSDRGGSVDLWAVALGDDGPAGEPKLVKRDIGSGAALTGFAGDGSLFYARDTGGGDIHIAPFDAATLRVTGEARKGVQVFEGYNSAPSWSPDGRHLAYTSRRNEISVGMGTSLFIREVATGEEREIRGPVRFNRVWSRPLFSPDGGRLLIQGDQPEGPGVFEVDVESGRVRRIASASRDGDVAVAGWDPSGGSAYYVLHEEGRRTTRLLRYDFATGEAGAVLELTPGWVRGSGRLSPDGRHLVWLVAAGERTTLRVASLSGGEIRDLYHADRPMEVSRFGGGFDGGAWTPDSRHFLFTLSRNEGWVSNHVREVLAVPLAGGEAASTELSAYMVRHLSIIDGGSAIGYASGPRTHNEIWVIDNVLPVLGQR